MMALGRFSGEKLPRLPFHSMVSVGALIAEQVGPAYEARNHGAPHLGERAEAELIQGFTVLRRLLRLTRMSSHSVGSIRAKS